MANQLEDFLEFQEGMLLGSEVVYEREGPVAVITLNRPERRNALNRAVCQLLHEAWSRVENDESVRVAIITGAGDKAFCAGYDIGEKEHGHGSQLADFVPRLETAAFISKPVIAAVNGAAMGAGMALVEACDLVFAADGAWFSLPEVKLGLGVAPFVQSLWTLPQHVLMELLLTGEPLGAPRAYEVGFVNRVTPLERLLGEAMSVAKLIARNAPLSVSASKAMVYRGIEAMGMSKAHRIASELFTPVSRSEDAKEGLRARAERRDPQWKGR